jgi:tetratricopeptide (TPR) repeat protein
LLLLFRPLNHLNFLRMKSLITFWSFVIICFILSTNAFAQNSISGKVSDGQLPLKVVSVFIEGTTTGLTTDANGKYAISASSKDILVFSYIGMETIEIIIEDVTKVLNIQMQLAIEELDAVTVTSKKKWTQLEFARNYYPDPSIINTNVGYLSPDLVGYHLRVIDGKNLNIKAYDILEAISNQLPGTVIRRKGEVKHLFPSSFNSSSPNALGVNFEVDGNIWYNYHPPVHLDISKVVRVALIYPENAIRLYGIKDGGPGMVVINTTDTNQGSNEEDNRPYDRARLRDNLYTNDAISANVILENGPNYLKELYASKDANAAYDVYEKYAPNFGSLYSFVLDVYRCLLEKFNNGKSAEKILKNHQLLFNKNLLAMKALAYVYQSNGEFKEANELYKKECVIRPNYVQSYLDMATSFRELGDYKKAAQLYSRFNYLTEQGYFAIQDSMMIATIFEREFNNLLTQHSEAILSKKEQRNFKNIEDSFEGTRFVFEWNDGEAEFELQFVNPEGRYFKTEHSLFADGEHIREEKLLGYTTEEFLIDGSMPGTWQVNVNYLGNKRLAPSYLKAVIYYDYGTMAQRKETKVFKMNLKNVKQELFTLNVHNSSIND